MAEIWWMLLGVGQLILIVRWRQAYVAHLKHQHGLALFRTELDQLRIEKDAP